MLERESEVMVWTKSARQGTFRDRCFGARRDPSTWRLKRRTRASHWPSLHTLIMLNMKAVTAASHAMDSTAARTIRNLQSHNGKEFTTIGTASRAATKGDFGIP